MFISFPSRVDTLAGFLLFCPSGCKRNASQAEFFDSRKSAELSGKSGPAAAVALSKSSTLFTLTNLR
jgi:hypothetical protein